MKSRLCNESNIHETDDEHHAPYKLMFLFFILFLGCLLKTIFAPLRIPYASAIILISFIGGILFNIFIDNDDTFLTLTTSSPDLLMGIFLPILIFESASRIEYHTLMKSFYSILFLSIIVYFISVFSITLLNKYLFFFHQWTFLQCLTLGIIFSITRPVTLMRPADYGKAKRLSIIFKGETMINNCLAIIVFNSIKNFVVNDQTWNTLEFFKTISIRLIGGISFGLIAGLLEIIGLPYLYDDPISEITITIAVPYILYWLCEQLYCSGVIAIVVLGLLLSNHKTAISSEISIFMEKFWDMLVLITNTIIYFFTALTLAELFKPNLQISFKENRIFIEIGLASKYSLLSMTINIDCCFRFSLVLNYLFCYIIRFLGIISFKFCRNSYLTWKECLLITLGGFKGSMCLILALTLSSEFQLIDKYLIHQKFQYEILIHTTTIVFLSNCINSTYSILLKVLDFTTMSQIKYLSMNQCIDSLDILLKEKINFLKQDKYLSNANWIFIEKYFHIKNPYMENLNSNENLFEETRIRIINIQKTSFWRQYRDYEISTKTIRILSSLCDFAIDTKNQYITINQLKSYYKPKTSDFIWKYLRLIINEICICMHNHCQKYERIPIDKCRLFIYKILNHKRFNLLITLIIILNIITTIVRLIVNTSNNKLNQILLIIQYICVVIYIIEFLLKIFTYGCRIYFQRWIYYRIELILLIFAIIECILQYYYPKSLIQIIVFIQLFRLYQIFQYLINNLNHFLERICNHSIALSFELCKACIISEDDILLKLNYIIENKEIREEFLQNSIQRRNEFVKELTFIQNEHPNISASVKTSAAIQKLLNYSKNIIHHMIKKGLLRENESHEITETINKRLHTKLVPSILHFSIPLNFLHIFPWLNNCDVLEYVLSHLHVKLYSLNEYIYQINTDHQGLFFITAGYVQIRKSLSKYFDALSTEKSSTQLENTNSQSDNFDEEFKDNSLLYAPGDIIGHIDLLNREKYTESCQCITNTLVWYLNSNDFMNLIQQFNYLQIFEKIWHYTAIQIAEITLYKYLNTFPYNITEQERIHIYGYLKYAFLIPQSYLNEQKIIYSSHELILIQGQLENIISSSIYMSPCFIQIEFGQCGLKPLNLNETKILVLRNICHTDENEFNSSKDLPNLLTHVTYDEKLSIFLPKISL